MTTPDPGTSGPDQHPDLDRDLDAGTDPQQARVRALLRSVGALDAAATDGGPADGATPADPVMPAVVLERLQGVLAALSGLAASVGPSEDTETAGSTSSTGPTAPTESTGPTPSAGSTGPADLTEHRRTRRSRLGRGRTHGSRTPRRSGALAAAAAAVVLVGAGGVAAATHRLPGGLFGGASGTSAASSATSSDARSTPSSPSVAPGTGAPTGPATPGTTASGTGTASALPTVSTRSFAQDVTALLGPGTTGSPGASSDGSGTSAGARRLPGTPSGGATPTSGSAPVPSTPAPSYAGCTPPRTTPGSDLRAILLDGRPAVLVVGPVLDGGRVATAWSCTGRSPLRSARVAAPR
ncbi:hypothetical protein GCM10027596_03010 [Nocardioides korecus]